MDYCFCVLTIIGTGVIEDCAIFTKAHESRLDSIGFGNRLCHAWRMSQIIRQLLSGVNFGALMILYSEIGGHVLTLFFGTCQNDQSGLISRRKVILLR